jgi:hypothetical protein
MESPKEDTLCNYGKFSIDLRIQYEKDQFMLKTLLCTMKTKIEKLEEILKTMGQLCSDHPPAAHKKPAHSGPINLFLDIR